MTTETTHTCATCGAALADPPATPPPQPARKAYMIEYHAPAGVAYEPIVTDDPAAFLALAKETAAAKTFKFEDYEPNEDAYRIHEIKIVTEEGDPAVHWVDPDSLAQLHADEILGLLEELIGSVEDAREARSQLDDDMATIETTARDASLELDRLRKKGGAQ
jgi:hypothetical protein